MSPRESDLKDVIETSRELRDKCEAYAMTARALAGAASDLAESFQQTISEIDEFTTRARDVLEDDTA